MQKLRKGCPEPPSWKDAQRHSGATGECQLCLREISCASDVPCRFLKGCRASRCKENGYICDGLQICCTGKTDSAGRKNLGAMSFAKSALQRPGWPILRNILLPSRLKNTDLGALGFRKTPLYLPARAFFQNILLPGNFISHNMAARRIWLNDFIARIVHLADLEV